MVNTDIGRVTRVNLKKIYYAKKEEEKNKHESRVRHFLMSTERKIERGNVKGCAIKAAAQFNLIGIGRYFNA